MMPKKNSWVCESEKTLIDSPFMSIIERNCRSSEDARPYKFFLFRSRHWSNVIPITEDGKVVLVRQYRIGIEEHTLEVPGGVHDPGDTDNRAAALREMEEETGYEALPGARCIELAWTHPNPAIQNNRCHSFIVGPVRKACIQRLDPGEMIEVLEVPIDELPGRLADGEMTHALILQGFFALMIRTPEGQELLRRELRAFSTSDS